jgi:hypothetical protein
LTEHRRGGGLSYTHTGMYGMFAIQEGVRQLHGEAAAQVGDPQVSVILGNGGMFATADGLVLGLQVSHGARPSIGPKARSTCSLRASGCHGPVPTIRMTGSGLLYSETS